MLMNRREYADVKRRLDQTQRELETELLTLERQTELEQRAAGLNRVLQRAAMVSRAKMGLFGALFAVALALLYEAFIVAPLHGSAPHTIAAWAKLSAPWALLGALVGVVLGPRS
jgi:hypothetical protein